METASLERLRALTLYVMRPWCRAASPLHIGTMANVFLLYMPPGNAEAMIHYEDTIKRKVASSRIFPHVSANLRAKLISVFGNSPIAVWGSAAGPRNRANFERMSQGDDLLIVEGDSIKLIGKVAAK